MAVRATLCLTLQTKTAGRTVHVPYIVKLFRKKKKLRLLVKTDIPSCTCLETDKSKLKVQKGILG